MFILTSLFNCRLNARVYFFCLLEKRILFLMTFFYIFIGFCCWTECANKMALWDACMEVYYSEIYQYSEGTHMYVHTKNITTFAFTSIINYILTILCSCFKVLCRHAGCVDVWHLIKIPMFCILKAYKYFAIYNHSKSRLFILYNRI